VEEEEEEEEEITILWKSIDNSASKRNIGTIL
jgi:hypothetical protein